MIQVLSTVSLVIAAYVTAGFVVAVAISRNDIADVMWGPGIWLASVVALISAGGGFSDHPIPAIGCVAIAVWGVRIARQIGLRFIGKRDEDFRYAQWRTSWRWFYLRSYLQIFILQGALMIAVAMSVVAAVQYPPNANFDGAIAAVGGVLFLAALAFETIADVQLNAFVRARRAKDAILTTGLWHYSRHPNYFGEVAAWWGLWIVMVAPAVAQPTASNIGIALLSLVSPITVTILILKVSGIPMLEAKYDGNAAFEAYKARTSAFVPWPPRAR
jgi:steroid 5-alpha reductase family enzyme